MDDDVEYVDDIDNDDNHDAEKYDGQWWMKMMMMIQLSIYGFPTCGTCTW